MTDSMNCLYSYLLESRIHDYLPGPAYLQLSIRSSAQESALRAALTPEQTALLETLQETRDCQAHMELQALFCAGWAVFRELA